jgi:predicted translin family RNA/ssDNA-binding protein
MSITIVVSSPIVNLHAFQQTPYTEGERIIKTNRDITNSSKKLIFQLHRIAQDENTTEGRIKVIEKSRSKFIEVQGLYAKLQKDVEGEWGWKFARSV